MSIVIAYPDHLRQASDPQAGEGVASFESVGAAATDLLLRASLAAATTRIAQGLEAQRESLATQWNEFIDRLGQEAPPALSLGAIERVLGDVAAAEDEDDDEPCACCEDEDDDDCLCPDCIAEAEAEAAAGDDSRVERLAEVGVERARGFITKLREQVSLGLDQWLDHNMEGVADWTTKHDTFNVRVDLGVEFSLPSLD